jgi:hypothetical protein
MLPGWNFDRSAALTSEPSTVEADAADPAAARGGATAALAADPTALRPPKRRTAVVAIAAIRRRARVSRFRAPVM